MEKFELLIRTMHAAHIARDEGRITVASALDRWVKKLSEMIDAENESGGSTDTARIGGKVPRRLSSRKG